MMVDYSGHFANYLSLYSVPSITNRQAAWRGKFPELQVELLLGDDLLCRAVPRSHSLEAFNAYRKLAPLLPSSPEKSMRANEIFHSPIEASINPMRTTIFIQRHVAHASIGGVSSQWTATSCKHKYYNPIMRFLLRWEVQLSLLVVKSVLFTSRPGHQSKRRHFSEPR
ncbi:hypothetical protein BJY00DRAFT_52686 [Aspergillus carlsbadensis]|nr:hypothetical protein BJY00DRAFT_52686 [Aspergillus carlsbadensis]